MDARITAVTEQLRPFRFSMAGVRGLKAPANLALNERVHRMWAEGRAVFHLAFGESRFPVHPKLAEALRANVHQRSYLPTLGIPELCEAIARYYQRRFEMTVSPDQVVVGPGSKALLYALILRHNQAEEARGRGA